MEGTFVLTQGIWQKLEFAINRNNGDARVVEWLSTGDNFEMVCGLARGTHVLTKVAQAVEKLLERIGEVTIVATTETFVAAIKFVINKKSDAKVKISDLGTNFKEWFLGKSEVPTSASTIVFDLLKKASADTIIITELGGEAKVETMLFQVFALMKKQGQGEEGALLVNGYANIFYVRDVNGVLRTVCVYWGDDGWRCLANPVGDPLGWNADVRVFSRKPLGTQSSD